MENPMNEKETRAEFLKQGINSEDIREIFLMYEDGAAWLAGSMKKVIENLEVSRCVKE